MKNIAIIDDEELDITTLSTHLKRFFDEKNIAVNIDLYRNPQQFLERFDHQFNLVFFDIEMPGLDGISLAKQIRDKDSNVRIIFVSSHPKYALDGYGLNALSLLVKPISYESLLLKMNSILPLINEDEEKQISFKYRDELKAIYIKDIVCVDINGHYLEVFLENGTSFENRGTLSEIETQIGSPLFSKCSHSCLINIKYIKEITDNSVILINGISKPISRNRKKSFMASVLSHFGKK